MFNVLEIWGVTTKASVWSECLMCVPKSSKDAERVCVTTLNVLSIQDVDTLLWWKKYEWKIITEQWHK